MKTINIELFKQFLCKLQNLRVPGDLFVGVDLSHSSVIQIITLQKRLRGFRVVASRCYSLQASEIEDKEVAKLLAKSAHLAVILPPIAVHYLLGKDGNSLSLQLAGERIKDSPTLEITRYSINETTDLIALCKSNRAVDLPSVFPENSTFCVSALIALSTLTEHYPISSGQMLTPAAEGIWKLAWGDQSCSLELLENYHPSMVVADKYGMPLEQLYNLAVDKSMLAAYGAALAILSPGLSDRKIWGYDTGKLPDPVRMKHLAFCAILFVGIQTMLIYSLLFLVGYHYSKQQLELELHTLSLSGQKRELVELRQANFVLKRQVKQLDSLAIPATYTAFQLLKFAEALPSGLWLSKLSTEKEERKWNITGYAREDTRVVTLLNNLQTLDNVASTELKQLLTKSEFRHNIKRENHHNGFVYFEVLIDIL